MKFAFMKVQLLETPWREAFVQGCVSVRPIAYVVCVTFRPPLPLASPLLPSHDCGPRPIYSAAVVDFFVPPLRLRLLRLRHLDNGRQEKEWSGVRFHFEGLIPAPISPANGENYFRLRETFMPSDL